MQSAGQQPDQDYQAQQTSDEHDQREGAHPQVIATPTSGRGVERHQTGRG